MFPTTGKSKLPPFLSYPVGAKLVSEMFADVPQAQSIGIHFGVYYRYSDKRYGKGEGGAYSVFAAEFSPGGSYLARDFEWVLMIEAVPRELKQVVADLLQKEAFPKTRDWLSEHAQIGEPRRYYRLTTHFDETERSLTFQEQISA